MNESAGTRRMNVKLTTADLRKGASDPVELVLRRHQLVPLDNSDDVVCLCDERRTFFGVVGHGFHVAAALREAGVVRDDC